MATQHHSQRGSRSDDVVLDGILVCTAGAAATCTVATAARYPGILALGLGLAYLTKPSRQDLLAQVRVRARAELSLGGGLVGWAASHIMSYAFASRFSFEDWVLFTVARDHIQGGVLVGAFGIWFAPR